MENNIEMMQENETVELHSDEAKTDRSAKKRKKQKFSLRKSCASLH